MTSVAIWTKLSSKMDDMANYIAIDQDRDGYMYMHIMVFYPKYHQDPNTRQDIQKKEEGFNLSEAYFSMDNPTKNRILIIGKFFSRNFIPCCILNVPRHLEWKASANILFMRTLL